MILEELKQISKELKDSAKSYDNSFKNTAIMATEGLIKQQELFNTHQNKEQLLTEDKKTNLLSSEVSRHQSFDRKYFIDKYGSLKKAKEEYKKLYGKKNYGRSWRDFLNIVKQLPSKEQPAKEQPVLTLEQRIKRIEDILISMGYSL